MYLSIIMYRIAIEILISSKWFATIAKECLVLIPYIINYVKNFLRKCTLSPSVAGS